MGATIMKTIQFYFRNTKYPGWQGKELGVIWYGKIRFEIQFGK